MTERRIRLSVPLTHARIGTHHCFVENISVSGALLLVDFAPTVGSTWKVTLTGGERELELAARVVRIVPAASGSGKTNFEWHIGVAWFNLTTETQHAIGIIYTMMTS